MTRRVSCRRPTFRSYRWRLTYCCKNEWSCTQRIYGNLTLRMSLLRWVTKNC